MGCVGLGPCLCWCWGVCLSVCGVDRLIIEVLVCVLNRLTVVDWSTLVLSECIVSFSNWEVVYLVRLVSICWCRVDADRHLLTEFGKFIFIIVPGAGEVL